MCLCDQLSKLDAKERKVGRMSLESYLATTQITLATKLLRTCSQPHSNTLATTQSTIETA